MIFIVYPMQYIAWDRIYKSQVKPSLGLYYLTAYVISDCCLIASPAVLEIFDAKRIAVTTLTFQVNDVIGHVTIRFP